MVAYAAACAGRLTAGSMRPAKNRRKTTSRPHGSQTRRVRRTAIPQGRTPPDRGRPAVVGIGASAGGLEALKAFFGAMPPKTGLVFVVVVHLDPTHESLLPELLSHTTGLTVEQARDRQPLEIDHVYVIPPNRTLTVDQGLLQVREVADRRSLRGAIDHFFRSLAEAERERAMAIVLSGTGTEGTLGTRAVKGEGGLVMAQAPDTAVQPGMPASAIATGLVDLVLAPEKMPEALLAYARNMPARRPRPAAAEAAPLDGLPAILAMLRARTKYDFRGYKRGTLQRRIERRMGLQQVETAKQYLDFLRSHPAEMDQLFKDLFIGVTSFFRDTSSFEELADKVLGVLVRERDQDTPIRIWVPGCSTGEEAYSIAIVMAEQIAAAQSSCRVLIFATDLDDDVLEVARAGTYPDSIALDVTPARLQRFFTREDHRYTIAKNIRESVVFAVQNLTTDPPFSKLDLVSCRNVLIYLEPEMQEKLLAVFHFALNPGGYLFLGSAEGVGPLDDLFTPISKRGRIFRRLGQSTHPPQAFPVPAPAATDASRVGAKVAPEPIMATLADQLLLDHFTPAAVVVRSGGQIVRFYGAMERYVALPKGEATLDVLTLARDALKPTLRAALHDAVRRNRATVIETAGVGRDVRTALRVTVTPIDGPQTAERLWVIVFEDVPPPAQAASRKVGRGQRDLVRRLETELRVTKKEQQHLVEQLESGNEELKAANEEVLSMNEELQSTNEELTTSKEELQSMNEELTTLNAQLEDKIQELTSVNDDLANLLVSTDIATVFLDTDLRIKRFTTAASRVLNVQKSDTGRPMNHLASNLVDVDLSRDARTVLEALTPLEKEVAAQDGRQYFLRVLPYRTASLTVQGVVLTLVDVTTLKKTERDLRAAREQMSEDLRRMTRLQELSAQLLAPSDLPSMLALVIRAAVDITRAEKGNIQLGDGTGVLTIAAHTGFDRPFLDFFARVDAHTDCACGAAMASRERVLVGDVTTSPIFAGQPALPVVAAAGVRAVQSTPLFDRAGQFIGMLSTHYRDAHHFDAADLRWVDLLARHAVDVIEWQRAQDVVARAQQELEARVADRTRWLSLMHEVVSEINAAATWDEALHRVLRRLCQSEHWQIGFVYLPGPENPETIAPMISCFDDDRFRAFHELSMRQTYARGERLPGRVYADIKPFWAVDTEALMAAIPVRAAAATVAGLRAGVAFPIPIRDEVVAVLEVFSDQEHLPSEQVTTLMLNVSDQIGRVLERERVMARMADLAWSEQQELLHTLHDSLGQTLTGVGMLSTGLRQSVPAGSEAAETAAEIARQTQRALDQVRQLAKKLFPVEVEAESLLAALRDLASATESLHKIDVRVKGKPPQALHDGKVATELYRIAQEAVTNGVKHGRAKTITIGLVGGNELTRLTIADDGIGIRHPVPGDGVGLRIMRHRATSIGAVLSVEPGATGGTVVTCTIRQPPRSREGHG
jgi:two-component system CheB/CheR fusion protein